MRRFAYRLALHLGEPNVDRLLSQLSARQLKEWMVYSQLEPFGEERADLRAAQIVSTLINLNRKKGALPIGIRDVVLLFGDAERPAPPPKSSSQLKAVALAIVAHQNMKES